MTDVKFESADPLFAEPEVDLDEWRDDPVRHRYVHGGFTGTNTRFSIYLPPAESYGGRFFQHITPVPDSENLAQEQPPGETNKVGFAIASGAYFLETNGGGVWGGYGSDDPTIAAYRANAASAQFSRAVASAMYGGHRPYGYAYGGSGGGFRTIGGAENTTGVWDGVVPYVIGSPMAIPNMFTVRMHAQRILRDQLDRIVDAVEPGGSGDPYDGLSDDQRDAFSEVTRMGFPPRSWFGHRTMGMHAFPVLYGGMRQADPTYFEQFWSEPGYLGYDSPPSVERDRLRHRCAVAEVLTRDEVEQREVPAGPRRRARGMVDTAWRDAGEPAPVPAGLRLSSPAPIAAEGADLLVHSGPSAGARIGLLSVHGDIAVFGPGDPDAILGVRPGDDVEVDNSGFLAAQTYHRHQVPDIDEYPVWAQFCDAEGSPEYPQRPLILGPLFAAAAAGTVQSGRYEGKMIVVESLLDREALPWQADWYRSRVRDHLGDALDDTFRLWFTENALHGDEQVQEDPTHAVSYLGMLHQALRDVSRWAEEDVPPPASTRYEVADGQIVVPGDAAERKGIQPVVSLTAGGATRAHVGAGEEVTLVATAAVPAGTGRIVEVQWDFDGAGRFPVHSEVDPAERVIVERTWSTEEPGTHFPVVRVVAQRDGAAGTPYARLQNLARVRVVVT